MKSKKMAANQPDGLFITFFPPSIVGNSKIKVIKGFTIEIDNDGKVEQYVITPEIIRKDTAEEAVLEVASNMSEAFSLSANSISDTVNNKFKKLGKKERLGKTTGKQIFHNTFANLNYKQKDA